MWLSALNVQFRDIRYVIPFFVQLWLFATPVIYPSSKVITLMEKYGLPAWLLGLNPMAGVVEGFRWCLLGTGTNPVPLLIVGCAVSAVLLITGGTEVAYDGRVAVLLEFGPCQGDCPLDFDGNGVVDEADLLIVIVFVLQNFGPCP